MRLRIPVVIAGLLCLSITPSLAEQSYSIHGAWECHQSTIVGNILTMQAFYIGGNGQAQMLNDERPIVFKYTFARNILTEYLYGEPQRFKISWHGPSHFTQAEIANPKDRMTCVKWDQ